MCCTVSHTHVIVFLLCIFFTLLVSYIGGWIEDIPAFLFMSVAILFPMLYYCTLKRKGIAPTSPICCEEGEERGEDLAYSSVNKPNVTIHQYGKSASRTTWNPF